MSLSSSFRHARCGIITHASSQRMPLMKTDKQVHLDPAELTSTPLMKKKKKKNLCYTDSVRLPQMKSQLKCTVQRISSLRHKSIPFLYLIP